MMYINGISSFVSIITLLASGSVGPVLTFCGRHPKIIGDATLLSVSAVASQFFIYSQVKEFGALVFAATMNVRQVVSILISYVTYHHSITMLQIVGLCIIFGALFYKSLSGLMAPSKEETKPLLEKKADTVDGTPTATAK